MKQQKYKVLSIKDLKLLIDRANKYAVEQNKEYNTVVLRMEHSDSKTHPGQLRYTEEFDNELRNNS